MYKVNISIMGRRPGNIVREGDRDFDSFKAWAERGDKKGGVLICEPCSEPEPESTGGSEETGSTEESISTGESTGSAPERPDDEGQEGSEE